jgi:cytochrome b involved in lipid metabolism
MSNSFCSTSYFELTLVHWDFQTGYLISQSPILLEAQKPERKLKGSDINEDEVEGTKQPNEQKLIDMKEVAKHNTKEDCWVVIQVSIT